ncbi:MFS transporter [Streptomyces sp. NPDC088354]|uniref:MFS transporter n=1 Tax=unclassified Streptomyces TaxID=2593676 RepID=UPI0029A3E121|nr:MFS transporter [Streptomyces sp. MI02-7b]MDX3073931.1 MFS transporter [Streptomyces sp. MI02-7b]
MSSRTAPSRALLPLVALFCAGYLAPYLMPTLVGRLSGGLALSGSQAGAVGSALLLASACAGFVLASRVDRIGRARLARRGLLLVAGGFATAAATHHVALVVAGCVVGGFGSGTSTAVAAVGISRQREPHRVTVLGLLATSAVAGALYLVLPSLGGGHALPFTAIAATALLVLPLTRWLPAAPVVPSRSGAAGPLPHRRSGMVLAVSMLCWSLAQNALWGVSGRIGLDRVGLSEAALGVVFAVALGGGLLGVTAAGALGPRLGRALPLGAGTALIAACVVVSSSAREASAFAAGEVLWNTFYPVVLSYAIGLAAALDGRGRWAVYAGSASSLGVACGPLTGAVLGARLGFPAMGGVLAGLLLVAAVPLTAVALGSAAGGRGRVAVAVRRRRSAAVAARSELGRAA